MRGYARSAAKRFDIFGTGAFAGVSYPRQATHPFHRCVGILPVTPGDSAGASPPPSEPSVGDGSTPGVQKEAVVIRDATVEDVERIESLTLEDFATDFSKVEIPSRDGPVSEPEMKAAVDTFLNSLERA